MIAVGDVLCCDLDGRMDRRIFACCLGFFELACSCFSMCCFFAFMMSFLSLCLYILCFVMFFCVGFSIRFWYNLCCRVIRFLIFGSHHAFLLRFGIASYFSIIDFIACWMLWKCWFVFWLVGVVFVISVLISSIILLFSFSYRPCESVLIFSLFFCRGGAL